jgi:dienelactone hydrolase
MGNIMRFKLIIFLCIAIMVPGISAIGWSGSEGDFDCDGDIDGSDIFILSLSFASSKCSLNSGSICESANHEDLIAIATGLGDSGFENYIFRSKFRSSSKTESGQPLILTGILTKPIGDDGPFPAVVVLHGCAGINNYRDLDWVERLVSWGYITLQVDSLGPRNVPDICGDNISLVPFPDRAQDAHDAKAFLAELSYVDQDRIAVFGWSHGAGTAIVAIEEDKKYVNDANPFSAAVVFYPYCFMPLDRLNTPLLILIGEKDENCPAGLCSNNMPTGSTEYEVNLKTYPGAYHDFDWEGVDTILNGKRLLYDPDATEDAIYRVRNFLKTHF